tara:strand:+ start:1640 stop:3781 length:2142 start_codon:yes stop_codon:yes gene_type:complete
MKLYFYIIKSKKLTKLEWNEYTILNNMLDNKIRIPKLTDNHILSRKIIDKIKNKVSSLVDYFPLYNIKIRNIVIVKQNNITTLVTKENYRFCDNYLLNIIKKEIITHKNKKLNKNQKIFYNKLKNIYLFFTNFNLDQLFFIYKKNLKLKDNNFTNLEKISYLPFLSQSIPYYTRQEILTMGLNFKLIKSIFNVNNDKLLLLYNKIIKNDFNSVLIQKNIYHINKNNGNNLVKFYTFHGSYYMNFYLRDRQNKIKDNFLEKLIKKLWNICLNAPKIKTEKFVYRFLYDDKFLQKLEINDIYQDYGFLSTTRNQFYNIDSATFGFILLKIIIPENSKGCLCVEPYSLFTTEEEIILPPYSKLRLINKNNDVEYNHINDTSEKKITKKYEFIYLGNKYTNNIFKTHKESIKTFNFFYRLNGNTLGKRISNFYNLVIKYNNNKKFYIQGKNKKYLFYCDFYDSTDVYYKFYSLKNNNGFYLYSLNNIGQYNFYIEIDKQLYVNYYMKFSNNNNDINNNEFLDIIARIANAFMIKNVIIYNSYNYTTQFINTTKNMNDENLKLNSAYINNFNLDIYNFLKYNKLMYNDKYVISNFNYFYLKFLEKYKVKEFIENKSIKLLDIYNNNYTGKNNFKAFYIFIIENYWNLIDEINKLINDYLVLNNQDINYTYTFNTHIYLYEKYKKLFSNIKYSTYLQDDKNFNNVYNNNYKKKLRSIVF